MVMNIWDRNYVSDKLRTNAAKNEIEIANFTQIT